MAEAPAPDGSTTVADEVNEPQPPVSNRRRTNLCRRCEKLDLRSEHFKINPESFISRRSLSLSAIASKPVSLAAILESRTSCSLCELIASSTTLSDGRPLLDEAPDLLSKASVSMWWEIDGRRPQSRSGKLVSRTRRLHLKWSTPRLSDSYLMLVAPERFYQANSDGEGGWDPGALFLGRRIDTEKSNEVLIMSWLRSCRDNHHQGCQVKDADNRAMRSIAESSWFGVIDVLEKCLTTLPIIDQHVVARGRGIGRAGGHTASSVPHHAPYVALSYVWGKAGGHEYVTTRSNVLLRRREGDLDRQWGSLPKTIRHAIKLVNALGFRYLWVDALCIIQDSARSWKLNANVMDQIYKNAAFTICAADGENAEAGLTAWDIEGRVLSNQHIGSCGGVRLMATQLSEDRIKTSSWNSRAWTFQERMLSQRCLVFCQGRVFFQCRSAVMSEDVVAEPKGGGWSLELARAPHQMLHEIDRRPITVYMDFVCLYSSRRLTKKTDVLAAFSGITNVLEQAMSAELVWGLPSSHFDLALLWQATGGRAVRRSSSSPSSGETGWGNGEFPSWSWCGWETTGETLLEYEAQFLEGVLADAHVFLEAHTWIEYFIRDDQGELQSVLSDGFIAEDHCHAIDKRWRGYASSTASRERPFSPSGIARHQGYTDYADTSGATEVEFEAFEHYTIPPSPPRSLVNDDEEEYPNDRDSQISRYSSPSSRVQGRPFVVIREPVPVQNDRADYDYCSRTTGKFVETYADSPYRVKMAPRRQRVASRPRRDLEEPHTLPILQFWTYFKTMHLSLSSEAAAPGAAHSSSRVAIHRYDILDQAGDWGGSIQLDSQCDLLRKNPALSPASSAEDEDKDERDTYEYDAPTYDFIAISEARNFTQRECPIWTYFVPKNRDQSEWDLLHVLLVERRNMVYYRVGLGKVFKAAFESALWKEIILG